MPRTEEANQSIRDERREQILVAATEVFAGKGYAGTRIDDIAVSAGVSKGLLYHYFASKEKVFVSIVERDLQGSIHLFQAALERSDTPWEKLHWLTSQIISGLASSPYAFMVVLQSYTSDAVPQEIRDFVADSSVQTQAILCQLITAGQAAGQVVQGDPEKLAALFGACLQGLAITAASTVQPSPYLPETDSFLRLLKA